MEFKFQRTSFLPIEGPIIIRIKQLQIMHANWHSLLIIPKHMLTTWNILIIFPIISLCTPIHLLCSFFHPPHSSLLAGNAQHRAAYDPYYRTNIMTTRST